MNNIRFQLFPKSMKGCSSHGCIIKGPHSGMGTNGTCECVANMSRQQLIMFQSRLEVFIRRFERLEEDNDALINIVQNMGNEND